MHDSYVQMLLSFKNWGIAAYGTAMRLRVSAFPTSHAVSCDGHRWHWKLNFYYWPQMAVIGKMNLLKTTCLTL